MNERQCDAYSSRIDRLAAAWRDVEVRYGFEFESPDISARAVMGISLILALESHHTKDFDRDRALELVSECLCMDGCPSCVGPGGENGYGGKQEALEILKELINVTPRS